MVHWDDDQRKDLLIGHADGTVRILLNIGSNTAPAFGAGTLLQVGPEGGRADIDVGERATPSIVDWNGDGKKDLIVGTKAGFIHLFINEGSDTAPAFRNDLLVEAGGSPLVVPSLRSSPVVVDADGDGKKDLLIGNTEGQLLYYRNIGSDTAPSFGDPFYVESNGIPIDLPDTPRSRPFPCDWAGDGRLDILIGAADGRVHLYQAATDVGPIPAMSIWGEVAVGLFTLTVGTLVYLRRQRAVAG